MRESKSKRVVASAGFSFCYFYGVVSLTIFVLVHQVPSAAALKCVECGKFDASQTPCPDTLPQAIDCDAGVTKCVTVSGKGSTDGKGVRGCLTAEREGYIALAAMYVDVEYCETDGCNGDLSATPPPTDDATVTTSIPAITTPVAQGDFNCVQCGKFDTNYEFCPDGPLPRPTPCPVNVKKCLTVYNSTEGKGTRGCLTKDLEDLLKLAGQYKAEYVVCETDGCNDRPVPTPTPFAPGPADVKSSSSPSLLPSADATIRVTLLALLVSAVGRVVLLV